MVINFAAGPAKLPEEVVKKVQNELVSWNNTGVSVMEMSHRSGWYKQIHENAIARLVELLNIPSNYKVILMQAGGTGMFASIPMNLIGRTGVADYLVTGSWSKKAAEEAQKYGKVNMVLPNTSKFTGVPSKDTWKLDPNASYVYYCDNETVHGVEFDSVPETNGVPLVADMSSNFLSRPIDVTKFGLIFAGAQKNVGTAGITVCIIREDLLGHALKETPSVFDFSVNLKSNSIYNTPPTFSIYVMGEVFEWIKKKGGIEAMYKSSLKKSQLVHEAIKKTNGFYHCPVEERFRSRMNVPFRIGSEAGDENLEKEFLAGAEAKGMIQLKGHRLVGGIRASLYNAITIEETEVLYRYMLDFYNNNSNKKNNV